MATGRVNTASLNVRDQPAGQVIGVLAQGDPVTTFTSDDSGQWLFVSAVVNGVTVLGWVSAQFIDLVDSGTDTPPGPNVAPAPTETGIFSDANWKIYTDVLGKRESSNNYKSVNQLGYCGRWQFGAGALIDGGYVRAHTPQSGLTAPGVWLGKDGVNSRDDWLNNETAQNSAMLVYTKAHYTALLKLGGLRQDSSVPRCAGLLAASHLVGVGGAMSLVRGTIAQDANGVTSAQYYALLSKAFGGSGQLEP
jgi:hypothetical protein